MKTTGIEIFKMFKYIVVLVVLFTVACSKERQPESQFELVSSDSTGIYFRNDLEYSKSFNVYTYRNFYNGGGVALGDINNDGLIDIFFTSNLNDNKLYLNLGNFRFEDITEKAGVAGSMGWSTGVTMVDINADGNLDIYVCNSGELNGDKKENELFINLGDLTFAEQASEFGLNDKGYSTHSSFFDFDHDGDLDVYLLNNSYQAIGSFNLERTDVRYQRDSLGGDKLLRNENGVFEDISESAGILGSVIGFGLGVTVGDVNRDGWDDIYVSNDFFERDYLYINNKDASFSEVLTESMNSISGASMGADLADVNNDGYPDLFVTEMLPADNDRLKTVTTFENWDKYQYTVANGYHHQFTRNTFQLNNQNTTFSEVGRLAGVEASDWSWGALLFDIDNDGFRDVFVANGIYQDLTNQDYLNYISNEEVIKSIVSNKGVDYKKLIDIIPSNPVSNKLFKNNGAMSFDDQTLELGLDSVSFSNGAAYGDLDNDGDLDLIVNNVNMPAFIYRNNLEQKGNWIQFSLRGEGMNKFGIGSKITVTSKGKQYYIEQQPARGFQSSIDPRPFIGLGDADKVDIQVQWASGKTTILNDVHTDQIVSLNEKEAEFLRKSKSDGTKPLFNFEEALQFSHQENDFVDFNRDRLLYHMNSTEGAKMAIGDVNGDGIPDVYFGGAKDQSGKIFLGNSEGFTLLENKSFEKDQISEDTESIFFDADGDSDLDLYVCSGGVEFPKTSSALIDRLYLNDGNGVFSKSDQVLPIQSRYINSSSVKTLDYDNDGDLDLFIGERMRAFQYGQKCDGFILQNNGKGIFSDVTNDIAPGLSQIGMITTAETADLNGDDMDDLIVAGEYMDPKIFINNDGKLDLIESGMQNYSGWWSSIMVSDVDGDGDKDLMIGNHGRNSRFKPSLDKPLKLYIGDYDNNGFEDPILTFTDGEGNSVPFALRHNLAEQMKFILKLFPDYESFKGVTMKKLLSEKQLSNAVVLEANFLETAMFINDGSGYFTQVDLPLEAQLSPIYSIAGRDFDMDGDLDYLLGGNLYNVKPEMGRYDASYGVYLENNGDGSFKCYPGNKGFVVEGQIRDIHIGNEKIFVSRSDQEALLFTY